MRTLFRCDRYTCSRFDERPGCFLHAGSAKLVSFGGPSRRTCDPGLLHDKSRVDENLEFARYDAITRFDPAHQFVERDAAAGVQKHLTHYD
jgi:hypothetical protein